MEDLKTIKTIFAIDVSSIIADTEDDLVGEAAVGYNYNLNSSLPELAYALSGFLKAIDEDEDIKNTLDATQSVGNAFITLLQAYYNNSSIND